ncbi:MAG: glycosyltransferase family 4 protein [Candidatus Latescibacterota bacterium]
MRICMTMFDEPVNDARIHKETATLVKMGHSVRIVCVKYDRADQEVRPPGAQVEPIYVGGKRSGKVRFLRFYRKAFWRAMRRNAEVYHAQDLYSLPVAYLAARAHRAGLIYDSHEYYLGMGSLVGRRFERSIWALVEKVFIGKADRVITVGDAIADTLRTRYGIRRPVVVRNCPAFTRSVRTDALREWLGIPKSVAILLYQGGMQRGRGLFMILESLKRVEGCCVVMLGNGHMLEALKEHARRLGLTDRTYFPGSVPLGELMHLTASADIGIHLIENTCLNHYYCIPNKLFEYLMAGLPVIMSDFPEIGKVVREAQAGLLVDPTHPEQIADALKKLLSDEDLRRHYSEHGLKAAQERYNWDRESSKLEGVYREPTLTRERSL